MNNSVRYVIGIDPSGSFHEGKGTTGICVYDKQTDTVVELQCVYAEKYRTMEEYFEANYKQIKFLCHKYHNDKIYPVVSMEDYLLYAKKAEAQINSKMETCQLIGYIRMMLYNMGIILRMRPAVQVKKRWTDAILVHRGLIIQNKNSYFHPKWKGALPMHLRDAIRHAVHCAEFEVNDL